MEVTNLWRCVVPWGPWVNPLQANRPHHTSSVGAGSRHGQVPTHCTRSVPPRSITTSRACGPTLDRDHVERVRDLRRGDRFDASAAPLSTQLGGRGLASDVTTGAGDVQKWVVDFIQFGGSEWCGGERASPGANSCPCMRVQVLVFWAVSPATVALKRSAGKSFHTDAGPVRRCPSTAAGAKS